MSRQSKHYNLPGDDEAKIEGFAASMAAYQGIKYHEAKDILVKEYARNMNKSGGDEDKFRENMDKFIQRNAIPR